MTPLERGLKSRGGEEDRISSRPLLYPLSHPASFWLKFTDAKKLEFKHVRLDYLNVEIEPGISEVSRGDCDRM